MSLALRWGRRVCVWMAVPLRGIRVVDVPGQAIFAKATAPFKQVGMMCFMAWMFGNSIQIFSIFMTFQLISAPFSAILSSGEGKRGNLEGRRPGLAERGRVRERMFRAAGPMRRRAALKWMDRVHAHACVPCMQQAIGMSAIACSPVDSLHAPPRGTASSPRPEPGLWRPGPLDLPPRPALVHTCLLPARAPLPRRCAPSLPRTAFPKDEEFKQLDVFTPRLLYCLIHMGQLVFGLWKLNAMGLLPAHPADWISTMAVPPSTEHAYAPLPSILGS